MTAIKRISSALVAAIGMITLVVIFAAPANAQPYVSAPTLSVSTTTPTAGGTLGIIGTGFGVTEVVTLTLHTQTFTLGSATTDSSGSFNTTVTLPADVIGSHTVVATGGTSGLSASAAITILAAATAAAPAAPAAPPATGGIAFTGVAVIGIGLLGVALLAAGSLTALAGRRRRMHI
jgi:ribosomal protein S11